MIDLVHNN